MYSGLVLLLFNKVTPAEINNLFSDGDLAKAEVPRFSKSSAQINKIHNIFVSVYVCACTCDTKAPLTPQEFNKTHVIYLNSPNLSTSIIQI